MPLSELAAARFAALSGLRPALLVVDVQVDFADPAAISAVCETPEELAAVEATVSQVERLVGEARSAGVPVVWSRLAARHDEWTVLNWLFRGRRDLPLGDDLPCVDGTPGADWYRVAPAPDELVVKKNAYSGFVGTDLDARLRAIGADWLVIAGLTTECCVFLTVNDAMQRDWPVVVAADACAAYSARDHEAALRMLAMNSSVVSTVDEVIPLLRA